MSLNHWYYEKADTRGFARFAEIRKQALRMPRELFLEAFPVPALLVVDAHQVSADGAILDQSEDMQLLTGTIAGVAILHYLDRLAFLCKRPGTRYADLVWVGRSSVNDIAVTVDSVSKVHGYFSLDNGKWTYTDRRSTNGSLLNDQPVDAGRKNVLHDGDRLQLGLEVTLVYMTPERLFERAIS